MRKNIFSEKVKLLLDSCRFGVLATLAENHPYANLIAILPYDNYKSIIFFTAPASRKYLNLAANPNASIFIDNRSNNDSDISDATGVNAAGRAVEIINKEPMARALAAFCEKHPGMSDFVNAPSTAMFQLKVDVYSFVEHFQQVTEIRPDS